MARRNFENLLRLQINQKGKLSQRIITEKDRFTIGSSPKNDLLLIGHHFPRKHVLLTRKNGFFHLRLQKHINGEVWVGDSRLDFSDLIKHDILPREGDCFLLKLTSAKRGHIDLGEVRIDFAFDGTRTTLPRFAGFSWYRVAIKEFFRDIPVKLIFLFFVLLHTTVIYSLRNVPLKENEPVNLEKVPERFAKFIIKPPVETEVPRTPTLATTESPTSSESSKGKKKEESTSERRGRRGGRSRRGSGRGNPAPSRGLLGLIGGVGASDKSSSVIDFLVSKDLVADLKGITGGGTHLKVNRNAKPSDDALLDQLIGTGGTGGIDDLISGFDEVETVTLRKKVQVDIDKVARKTGSSEAMGYRDDQSIMNVVLARSGRITYIYEKYLKRNPRLRGKISIEFTIAANGFVIDCRIIESTVRNPDFEREILNVFRRLKFDPIPQGNVKVVYPLVFSKIEG